MSREQTEPRRIEVIADNMAILEAMAAAERLVAGFADASARRMLISHLTSQHGSIRVPGLQGLITGDTT